MEASSTQQPDFSEDSPGTVRKSLPNQTMQLVNACGEEPLGPGQIERNGLETQQFYHWPTKQVPGASGSSNECPVRVRAAWL